MNETQATKRLNANKQENTSNKTRDNTNLEIESYQNAIKYPKVKQQHPTNKATSTSNDTQQSTQRIQPSIKNNNNNQNHKQ